jgi:molybdopterin-containing oxidoreductase family iron-sulfur binding subunit
MTNHAQDPEALSPAHRGREFWRSLEELAESPTFHEWLKREFPQGAAEMRDPRSRRSFLKLMGASLALASLTGCQFAIKPPARKIVPYVRQPELIVPGKPLFYATGFVHHGYALGVLAESHEGRPTKIEGNPDHPSSQGATDQFAQASILTMYDPDRSQVVLNAGQASSWQEFVTAATAALQQAGNQGAGVRILSGTITSPTLQADLQKLIGAFPQARWDQYEPVSSSEAAAGARLAFGQDVHPVYDFSQANIVLSLDADFLAVGPGSVRYARDFSDRRRVRKEQRTMNRLYVAEPIPTPTGTIADHRLPIRASQVESLARAVAQALGVAGVAAGAPLSQKESTWAAAVAADLQANRGASIVIAGETQPAIVHALAHAINQALGNSGTTVSYIAPLEVNPGAQLAALTNLVTEMNAGQVQALLMLGVNPVYTAPADLDFAAALQKVPFSMHHGLYADETGLASTWHVPSTHYLEEWGDARGHDGTLTIIQPLIAPLYPDSRSASDLLNALAGTPDQGGYNALTAYWRGQNLGANFDQAWMKILHDGLVPGTAPAAANVTVSTDFAAGAVAAPIQDLEIVFRPDPTIDDGFYSNNGWLQELPKPITKLTWDNAAMLSPTTAGQLGLTSGDIVEISLNGRNVTAPVQVVPGQADNTIVATLGYGRNTNWRITNPEFDARAPFGIGDDRTRSVLGFNAYALRTSQAPFFAGGAQVRKTASNFKMANSQNHFMLEGRKNDIVPSGTLEQFVQNEEFLHGEKHEAVSLFPGYEYNSYAWGMSIDLSVCTGCNACVIACQSENNIAVVGKEQVWRGREMQWMRIDQYFEGDPADPQVANQPMLCQHCELAPCEIVCPVAATSHDAEGLNVMTYNRCVGTKYCSNNCPYKVRHFNYLQYGYLDRSDDDYQNRPKSIKLMYNPDVTVRSRGVMEKCTFCTQRINEARIEAEKVNRRIGDGEIITACQQACPTQAIVFGDINDPNAQVTKLKAEPTTYSALPELNTRPRVTYMARLRNLNPALGGAETKTE